MTVAEKPQWQDALDRANGFRLEAAAQRRRLRGAPEREIVRALIDPTPEIANFRLRSLFEGNRGVIPRIGSLRIQRAFHRLEESHPCGRRNWTTELRLRQLTQVERRRLVAALFAVRSSVVRHRVTPRGVVPA